MPAYQYSALDASGKQHKGIMDGDSARQIRQQLRDQALTPLQVEAVQHKQTGQSRWFQKKLTAYDLALMTRQLSVLIAASIPLEEPLPNKVKRNTLKVYFFLYVLKS